MHDKIEHWLLRDPDPETRDELKSLLQENQHTELAKRFGKRLTFGTAGIRGQTGAGPARMNRLVIIETTLGLANYLLETVPNATAKGVVVGYDGRKDSLQFAKSCASVFAAKRFSVYLFHFMVGTPLLAFALRNKQAAAGVMITASHNQASDNGYKVFMENGAQLLPPHDKNIALKIEEAAKSPLPSLDYAKACKSHSIAMMHEDITEKYLQAILPKMPKAPSSLCIAYTPLHGTGFPFAKAALKRAGFSNLHPVISQQDPDPAFSTLTSPNPENAQAMAEVLKVAKEINADLCCANDPDADRLAVAVKNTANEFQTLSGDQLGAIFGHFLITQNKRFPCAVLTTIVSSRLLQQIAKHHHVEYFETLTGFKWIANHAIQLQKKGIQFLFGYEEAIGFLTNTAVYDKDGISALVCICIIAEKLKKENKTLLDYLEQLYRRYGLYLTSQKSLQLTNENQHLISKLRNNPPKQIAYQTVIKVSDFLIDKKNLPKSNVLMYFLADNTRIIIRPSGTEPTIKCYYEMIAPISDNESYHEAEKSLQQRLASLVQSHQKELLNNCN